jgi:DNA-binding beta-propeller fold protein YncE
MMKHRRPPWLWVALVTVMMMVLAACTGSSADLDEAQAEIEQLQADLAAAQTQVAAGSLETQTVFVAGELAPAVEPQALGDGWANSESVRGGLHLVATFDSSGPDAWDIDAHPRVYFTSESYASNWFRDTDEGKTLAASDDFENFVGWHAVDAYSKEVVASALYSYEGNIVRGPHGVGVSPDGQWGYLGWTEETDTGRTNYVGVINVRTMKLDKLMKQESWREGAMSAQALHHIQGWTDVDGNEYVILQWGFGATGGPHHILNPNDDNRVHRSITREDVSPMGHPFTTPSPDGKWVYVSVGSNEIRSNHAPAAGVAKVNVDTGEVIYVMGTGHHPIGITHTQDGKYTYVVDGHASWLYKIDNELNEVVDDTSTGIAGPYGICLNWDETQAWIDGKGEGTHNKGNSMGVVDLTSFSAARNVGNLPFHLGGSASSVDHCALHPDPDVNEIWVSNMAGWETIVIDLNALEVEAYIPTPNGGDTHGMAFVWYDGGWDNGELMVDMGGPKSMALRADIAARAAAAAAEASG